MHLGFMCDLVRSIISSKVIDGGLSYLIVMYPVSSKNGCLGQYIGAWGGAGIGIGFVRVVVVVVVCSSDVAFGGTIDCVWFVLSMST